MMVGTREHHWWGRNRGQTTVFATSEPVSPISLFALCRRSAQLHYLIQNTTDFRKTRIGQVAHRVRGSFTNTPIE